MGSTGGFIRNFKRWKLIPMKTLFIIKIGGNIVDDETALEIFLQSFAAISSPKILVHGGGKLATRVAEAMGIQQQMIEGRRITDAETLKIVTMVYAGFINKNIVSKLQFHHNNAIGITGADGNAILAHKRISKTDYGFAGDVDAVNIDFFLQLLENGFVPVIAPITHNGEGQLLNTNADTMAQTIATALSKEYDTTLIYSFEKSGVLLDVADESSCISVLTPDYYATLKEKQLIFAGMIPKLDNAFAAIHAGVKKVIIGNASALPNLLVGKTGTTIQHG